MSPRPFNNPRT